MSNLDSQISTTPQLPSSGPDKAGGGLTKGGSSEGDIGGSSYVPACTRLTVAEVARHNNREDCWVIINGEVLDVTGFLPDHPGGEKSILNFAGRDASKMFNMIHSPDVIQRYLSAEAVLGPVVEEVPVDEVSSEVPQSPRAADSSRGGTLPMHEPSQQCMEEPESPQAVGSATSTTHHGCSVQSVGSEESDLAVEGQEYWVILGGEVHDITSALPQLLQGTDASILEYGGMHLDEAIDCPPVSRMLVELADGSEVTVVDFLPEGSVGAQRHIPAAEVAKHCSEDDCWIIVNGKVIDVTTFLPDHPGGKSPILSVAGQDASDKYNLVHPPDFIQKYVPSLVLGDLADDDAKAPAPEVASAPGAEVRADRSVPQRPTSIMDGFAVLPVENSHESVHLDEAVPYRQLHVASSVTAGHGVAHVEGFLNASYVTTGTQLGSGDYAVVKIEDCEISGDLVRVPVEGVRAGLNIRQVGSDMEQGTIVASRGASITPTLLALLRDVAHEVELMPVLKVAVVSSGDELFSGETVDTNGPMLEGLLSERFGAAVEIERAPPLEDDFDKERESLLALAASCDVVISTGAVSKGSKDFIKKILDQEGKLHFGEVCLKPGKPTTFATLGDTPFFALPGNPASAYVTFHVFVAPFLEASLTGRQTRGDITVTLAEEFHQTDSVRPELVRASVSATGEGRLVARGVSGGSCQRSSRLFSCVDVNALVKLPAGAGKVPRGTRVPCILTGPIEPSVGEEAEVASRSELEAEAFAFRKLVAWLQDRTDVQNIDLMNLAGFCRNCLSKWYAEGASVELEDARERIYGR
ncbi:hypothetical protein FOL47_009784 [Perkinsus chesapeaki]|uniref:Cytochrome b5 heme-binding domain-containing protein n=1 Tax=Perkinsus chesapeaki TaxID=330153 RepID=A0A7J6L6D4_PERCH|nr:hypothetical protein FOL47_009784 [Perkinsus chesapeaki]